jgi:phenylalanine-4-hydroxylase
MRLGDGNGPEIPEDWSRHFVDQDYGRYTAADHDVWREMRRRATQMVEEFEARLHPEYVRGFWELIAPWSTIPRLAEIDARLEALGWRTVCVDGYIPAGVYAGLMACGIFPVSRNLRRNEHIDFSPTPDMAHDLFGHIPLLVCPEHRHFLRRLAGSMAAAPSNLWDTVLYEANRDMGLLRSEPDCDPEQLHAAEQLVSWVQRKLAQVPSPLTHLSRMYLWSMEFGLMGTASDFQIYGAGLLSAPAEARALCRHPVELLTYSADVIRHDIFFSDPQVRYFVTPGYAHLEAVLEQYEREADHPMMHETWKALDAPARLGT